MKNLKIGAKISLGFACIAVLLLTIAVMSIVSSIYTGSNIDEVDVYSGLQVSANNVMDILNETRITASVLYNTRLDSAFSDVSKQLMYCDLRLKKLIEYIDANPECLEFKDNINKFQTFYTKWTSEIKALGTEYDLNAYLDAVQRESFKEKAQAAHLIDLQAHEILSNTVADIDFAVSKKMQATKDFSFISLVIVIIISIFSIVVAAFLAVIIIRSITSPISYMRDALVQIGQTGELMIASEQYNKMRSVASGKDESAQCTSALLVLIDRLNDVGDKLSSVAAGDLTVKSALQSERDTMGLALDKMLNNLNQKFGTIAQSTLQVNGKAEQLFKGSQLISSGSQLQLESVGHLSDSVVHASESTEEITGLASEASSLADSIENTARIGTEKMRQMIDATKGINEASQAIGKVIKVIDDIAFQTNILALNAAVEAARAGQHGKGFAVVADEVRNLANKSAVAAKDTGTLIEDTMQKAALGESIAGDTAKSLEDIVRGVEKSNTLIGSMASLSHEQSSDIRTIIDDVEHVKSIVEQNSTIAEQSATTTGDISDQVRMLQNLVAQFKLAGDVRHTTGIGGMSIENI